MENKIINNSYDLYADGGNYINQLKIFHAYFNTIPNIKSIKEIDLIKVKQFISEMEGEIEIFSKVGSGSRFICDIPFKLSLSNNYFHRE